MTTQAQQDWFDHLKGISASPNLDTGRNLGKRCPWCHDVFFTYQTPGKERQPYQSEPEPRNGMGARETCGHPQCHDAEDTHQFQRRLVFRAEIARHRAHQPQAGPAMLEVM